MEEEIEDIEKRIMRKMLRDIEKTSHTENSIIVSNYSKFVETVQLRKIIENDY